MQLPLSERFPLPSPVSTESLFFGGKGYRIANTFDVLTKGNESHATVERYQRTCISPDPASRLTVSCLLNCLLQVPCRRGCGHEYCSSACEEAAWSGWHCLMCTSGVAVSGAEAGAGATTAEAGGSSSSGAHGSGAGSLSSGPSGSTSGRERQQEGVQAEDKCGVTVDRKAMAAFAEHALQTNEIFLLAAKVRQCGAAVSVVTGGSPPCQCMTHSFRSAINEGIYCFIRDGDVP